MFKKPQAIKILTMLMGQLPKPVTMISFSAATLFLNSSIQKKGSRKLKEQALYSAILKKMKKQSIFLPLAILALTLSFSCSNYKKASTGKDSSKSTFDLAIAKKEIEEINQNYMGLVAKGDSIGVANLYANDARLFLSGRPVVVGRANIQTAFSHLLNSGVTKLDIETIEVFGTAELLAEEGHVTIYVKGKAFADEKSIILWKKEDGKWKLFRDIANPNSR